jgi:hypothetical protein
MLIWGLIMAKAKAGYTAATSKDHSTVKSQYKNVFTILVLVVVACVAQMKYENSFKELANPNLAMSIYEADEESVEVIDYKELLNKAAKAWKSEEPKTSKKSSGKPAKVSSSKKVN